MKKKRFSYVMIGVFASSCLVGKNKPQAKSAKPAMIISGVAIAVGFALYSSGYFLRQAAGCDGAYGS